MATIDQDSGAVVPDNATQPFPNPGETAFDHAAEAKSLVERQYRDSPNLQALLAGLSAEAQKIEDCAITIPPLDDPNVATGVNLDVTGDLVGQSRVLSDGTSVDDPTFRTYIAARIIRNSTIGSSPQFLAAVKEILGPTPFRYYDLGHMYVGLEVATGAAPSSDTVSLLETLTPRAMGVQVGREWYDPTEYFAFDEDTSSAAKGFGELGDPTQGGDFAELF